MLCYQAGAQSFFNLLLCSECLAKCLSHSDYLVFIGGWINKYIKQGYRGRTLAQKSWWPRLEKWHWNCGNMDGFKRLDCDNECVRAKSLQLGPTLCDSMDCSPSGSSVQGILQARILEWVVMPSCKGSSQSRDHIWILVSSVSSPALAGGFYITSTTWEALWQYTGPHNMGPRVSLMSSLPFRDGSGFLTMSLYIFSHL